MPAWTRSVSIREHLSLREVCAIMRLLSLLMIVFTVGCAPYDPSADYPCDNPEYTLLGIKYCIYPGATPLNPGRLDYQYTATANCVGTWVDPKEITIVSTVDDVEFGVDYTAEGMTYDYRYIVINTIKAPGQRYSLLNHEYVHVLLHDNSHRNEAFERCGWHVY